MGIEAELLRWIINAYGKRNTAAHSGVGKLIDYCNFKELGRLLLEDWMFLELDAPSSMNYDTGMTKKVLRIIYEENYRELRWEGEKRKPSFTLSSNAKRRLLSRGEPESPEDEEEEKKTSKEACKDWGFPSGFD